MNESVHPLLMCGILIKTPSWNPLIFLLSPFKGSPFQHQHLKIAGALCMELTRHLDRVLQLAQSVRFLTGYPHFTHILHISFQMKII